MCRLCWPTHDSGRSCVSHRSRNNFRIMQPGWHKYTYIASSLLLKLKDDVFKPVPIPHFIPRIITIFMINFLNFKNSKIRWNRWIKKMNRTTCSKSNLSRIYIESMEMEKIQSSVNVFRYLGSIIARYSLNLLLNQYRIESRTIRYRRQSISVWYFIHSISFYFWIKTRYRCTSFEFEISNFPNGILYHPFDNQLESPIISLLY